MRTFTLSPPPADRIPTRQFVKGWTIFRLIFSALLLVLFFTGLIEYQSQGMRAMFVAGWLLFLPSPFVLAIWDHFDTDTAMERAWLFLALDLAGLMAMAYTAFPGSDPFYPLFVGLALFYATVAQRRWVWYVGAGIGAVYLFAHITHWLNFDEEAFYIAFALLKGSAIPLLGYFLAEWMEERLVREKEAEANRLQIITLNESLTRRLAELHIVAEITEVIHSTLDFESIGHVVLDSLKKAIDIPTCSLMVIDRSSDETIFNASSGMDEDGMEPTMTGYYAVPDSLGEIDEKDSMFTCTNIVEHNDMGVVFCCPADRLDQLTGDDMLVLQAVSSELVVAVENSQLYQLTKRLSITDELTGLHNYRFLQQRLDQEYERANRYNRYMSLMMIDIDHFKDFNDNHGHIAGDAALGDLAQILLAAVREVDIVTRYGGEEFAIILPETDAAGAFVVAEKIREVTSEYDFADADGNRTESMTVSIGVATFPVHSLDREGLLRQADDALYQAKHFGRDRVRAPRISSDSVS